MRPSDRTWGQSTPYCRWLSFLLPGTSIQTAGQQDLLISTLLDSQSCEALHGPQLPSLSMLWPLQPTSANTQGFIGLEVLFVICGFLATISLIPMLEDRRRPVKQASKVSRHFEESGHCWVAAVGPTTLLQPPGDLAAPMTHGRMGRQRYVGASVADCGAVLHGVLH